MDALRSLWSVPKVLHDIRRGADLMTIRVGDEVGPYKVQQLLGRGAFSCRSSSVSPRQQNKNCADDVVWKSVEICGDCMSLELAL